MYFDQGSFDIRCEWGMEGLKELLLDSRAVVIVDVLSFSTSVDIAAGNGALVYPYIPQQGPFGCGLRQVPERTVGQRHPGVQRGRIFTFPFVPGGHTLRHCPGPSLSQRVYTILVDRRHSHIRRLPTERNGPCRFFTTVRNRNQFHSRGERWKQQQTLRPRSKT